MKTLVILGRQPAIGLAELESIFGPALIKPLPGGAAIIDVPTSEIPFARLGGTIKACKILTTLDTTDWLKIEKFLIPACEEHAKNLDEGKLTIGLSVLGLSVNKKSLERTGLNIKKAIKASGRPVRIVPNKTNEISTAQVLHNKLTHEHGWELVFYRIGDQTILARTCFVQDIESYSARDQQRPMRDARVGMLPPKLAQIIINLATGKIDQRGSELEESTQPHGSNIPTTLPKSSPVILDPFCGTGVILQEALLMGYRALGTDIDSRMIEYSKANIDWLCNNWHISNDSQINIGDARNFKWEMGENIYVACEGYLGLPFSHLPSEKQLQESIQSSNTIIKGFLKNLSSQVSPGFRACIGMPVWHIKDKTTHLPCIAQLSAIGWKRIQFVHAKNDDLIYHREGQIVGRELVVIEKI